MSGKVNMTPTLRKFRGGQSGTRNVFLKSVTYRPTLSKSRGVPVKKITLYKVQEIVTTSPSIQNPNLSVIAAPPLPSSLPLVEFKPSLAAHQLFSSVVFDYHI